MGLIRNPDIIRLTPDDPIANYLGAKVVPGNGIVFTRRVVSRIGYQAIISQDGPGAGSSGVVVTLEGEVQIPPNASLVLINAATQPAIITLPHPGEVIGWSSLVCLDNSHGITLLSPNEGVTPEAATGDGILNDVMVDTSTNIFDRSNIEFQAAGDSLIFASNRLDTWFCIGKYSANWYA